MSSTLDLNGTTVTLSTDTTYNYYQITDTSASHNGVLAMSAGSVLEFDNKSGAGFTAAASAITININGTRTNNCRIKSADPSPTYTWAMPASTTYINADWCEIGSYSGLTANNYWAFSNCVFVGSRYISVDEVLQILNISDKIEPIDLGRLIEHSDRQVKSQLQMSGISAPTSDDSLKTASLFITTANLLMRFRMDGTKPANLSMGSLSMSDNIDEAIRTLRADAKDLVQEYIENHSTHGRYRIFVKKVNP